MKYQAIANGGGLLNIKKGIVAFFTFVFVITAFSSVALAQDFGRDLGAGAVGATFSLVFFLIGIAIFLAILAAVGASVGFLLMKNFESIPSEHHKMPIKQVWHMAIPGYNAYWAFPALQGLSDSYKSYFDATGETGVGDCGKQKGFIAAICYAVWVGISVVSMLQIPFVGCLGTVSALAGLVFLILYFVVVFDLKKKIQLTGGAAPESPETE